MDMPPAQYVTTSDGVSIAFATFGDGPPIVFASNIWGDLNWYPVREGTALVGSSPRLIFDDLAALGWKVVAYDVRGMGASSRSLAEFGVEGRRRDLEAVVGKLDLDSFALGARDTGCPIAIDYAARNPRRVWALVLLDPWLAGQRRYMETQPARAQALVQPMAEDDWHYYTLTLGNLVTHYKDPVRAQAYAEFFRKSASPKVFLAYREALRSMDVTPQAGELLGVPALVVHQRTFTFGSFELAQEVALRIDSARFVSVDGGEEELSAIKAFLNEHKPALEEINYSSLSGREIEVLRLIARGRTNQQIADELVISLNTVLRHVTNIFTKTESKNRAEAAAYFIRQGLL